MLALVDCNACYASCEQIYRPDLRGKPIVVLSNNDGCVVTRNKEAKALNIPDLEPYFKIKHLLQQHQVHVFSSNYELYGDTSQRIMSMLEGYGNAIEVYSIDEAFLDVDGFTDLYAHGQLIKQACWKEQRMPVCVGIAPTKTLAKLANHIAKKSVKLNGVCVIENITEWHKLFSKLPVNKVWGVGSRIAKRLADCHILTVEDLRQQNPKELRADFGGNTGTHYPGIEWRTLPEPGYATRAETTDILQPFIQQENHIAARPQRKRCQLRRACRRKTAPAKQPCLPCVCDDANLAFYDTVLWQ
jgi:DNA polymerase V